MDQLAGLTEEARKLALDRFRLLQPHLEGKRPLKAVVAAAGVPFRTAQRWVAEPSPRTRYYWLLLAEGHLTRRVFSAMLWRIWALPVPAG